MDPFLPIEQPDLALFRGVEGFFALTSRRLLGVVDDGGRLLVDSVRSRSCVRYTARFLDTHSRDPQDERILIAVVLPNCGNTPWKSSSLILCENVFRDIYSLDRREHATLSAYHRRNMVRSVHQGMELLLDFRRRQAPKTQVYCPILFDRGTRLREYRCKASYPAAKDNEDVRVLEVLNYVALVSEAKRGAPAIKGLADAIYQNGITRERRGVQSFALSEGPRREETTKVYERNSCAPAPSAQWPGVVVPENVTRRQG